MLTQNEDEPIDLDYNISITKCAFINDCRKIKEIVRNTLNDILSELDFDDVSDSTSVLTTGEIYLDDYPDSSFTIDICIVKEDENGMHRLIHQKSGCLYTGRYFWNLIPNSSNLQLKVRCLKDNGLWLDVRERYLKKKNLNLRRSGNVDFIMNGGTIQPSFICFIEAVNEVYNQL